MKKTKMGLVLAMASLLLGSCVGPLTFQDPASARQSPAYQNQRRFGQRPLMQPESDFSAQDAGYGLQPDAARIPGGDRSQLQQPAPQQVLGQESRLPANPELMGWNGEVAMGAGEGQTRMAQGLSKHGLEPQVQGRMHILNLYQEALDERDNLLIELERLNSALREGEQLLTQLRSSEKEYAQRLASLEEVKRTLVQQNRDLSARLTLAQIRRLESDKLLLETQIAMHSNAAQEAAEGEVEPVLVSEK